MYCRVKYLSTDVSEVCATSIIRAVMKSHIILVGGLEEKRWIERQRCSVKIRSNSKANNLWWPLSLLYNMWMITNLYKNLNPLEHFDTCGMSDHFDGFGFKVSDESRLSLFCKEQMSRAYGSFLGIVRPLFRNM
jgi:hypothetical protein